MGTLRPLITNTIAAAVAASLGLASCSTAVPTAELTPVAVVPENKAGVSSGYIPESDPVVDCDLPLDTSGLADLADSLAMLTASISLVEARDSACGPPPDEERQCRALFLLGATDPVLVWASGPDQLATQESVDVWLYAAADGLASSSVASSETWEKLVRFSDRIGPALASNNEEAIANLVIERGEAAETLSVLEGVCGL